MGDIQFKNGAAVESNFDTYPVTRINQAPLLVKTTIIDSDQLPTGAGEPGVPPVAPSIANAIFVAGGKRIREMPFNKFYRV